VVGVHVYRSKAAANEIHQLLTQGKSLDEFAAEATKDQLKSGLLSALEDNSPEVRKNTVKYLLTHRSMGSEELLPDAQKTLSKIIAGELTASTRGQEDVRALVLFLRKHPDQSSVQLLLVLARRPDLYTEEREEPRDIDDERPDRAREPRTFFREISKALQRCTDHKLGQMTRGSGYTQAERDKIAAGWVDLWERLQQDDANDPNKQDLTSRYDEHRQRASSIIHMDLEICHG